TKNRIPFAVRSGVTFFELAHIKDVLAFLRVIYNSQDEISWNRILKLLPGVGAVTAQKLLLQIQAVQSIHELSSETFLKTVPKKARMKWSDLVRLFQELQGAESVSEMIFAIVTCFYAEIAKSLFENWEDRKDDIATLAGYSSKFDNLNSFLNELSLVGNEDFAFSDTEEKDQEKVVLTTIHQAKGLEWDHVFVIALSEGLFPSGHSLFSDEQTEEERRLFYVAVTRAKKKLYLTSPKNVKIWGQDKHFSVSKFIEEIDENLLYKEPFRKEVTKVYRFE
ncbi:MAG: DNA helicase-2/ATP-dependent DNA helicase PcrA, partial [bacterium]